MDASSPWKLDGLHRPRFAAYAKLLKLKNDGQIEASSSVSELPDNVPEIVEQDDTVTIDVNVLSQSDDDNLKRSFLDRLSELISINKGGFFVCAAIMIEWPDHVDILVARNKEFKAKDPVLSTLKHLESSLQDICMLSVHGQYNSVCYPRNNDELKPNTLDPLRIDALQTLWATMIQSYRIRLAGFIANANMILGRVQPQIIREDHIYSREEPLSLPSHIMELQTLMNKVALPSTQAGLERIVWKAHEIYLRHSEQAFRNSFGGKVSTKLRIAIGFIGRLHTCFEIFIKVSERLSNFRGLKILPANTQSTVRDSSIDSWSAKKTFSSLGLSFDDTTIGLTVGTGKNKNTWTRYKLDQRFDKLKSPYAPVHAEVQLLLASARHNCTGAHVFEYLGCSKRCCFLCSRFIQYYGPFSTRGCHGRLYHLWTVPKLQGFSPGQVHHVTRVLKRIEQAMDDLIRKRTAGHLQHAKESSVGGTNKTIDRDFANGHMGNLVSQYLMFQREQILSSLEHTSDSISESVKSSQHPRGPLTTESVLSSSDTLIRNSLKMSSTTESMSGKCGGCYQRTKNRCTFCSRGWFCNRKCQDRMRLDHLSKCSARSITAADILFEDVLQDNLPEDPLVLEHFGFARCRHAREKSHLFGLYHGLFINLEVSPNDLNKWQAEDVLVPRIIEAFSRLPEQSRGGYFPWFLKNQHIVKQSVHHPSSESDSLEQVLHAARSCLGPEDQNMNPAEFEPPAKKYCFLFYAIVLDGVHPDPNWRQLDLWYDFGFAVCADRHEEGRLGALYGRLVGGDKWRRDYEQSLTGTSFRTSTPSTCSFDKFWRAWQSGNLAKLLNGVRDTNNGHSPPNTQTRMAHLLQEFLSSPLEQHGLRPLVWRLRHFLALNENTPLGGFPEIRAAAQSYGFLPQLNARTNIQLRQCYRRLLEKEDPHKIERARTTGKLLAYTEKHFDNIDTTVAAVLRGLSAQ